MTTIDTLMALALTYRLAGSASRDEHEEALRTALTEALAFQPDWADFNNGRECGRIEATEALAQPAREPLSKEQMWSLWNSQGSDEMNQTEAFAFARAVERAHLIGIGSDK